jgi:hypothetical protein
MIILAITDSIGGTKAGIAQTVFLFVFNTYFAVGWLGITWLYPAVSLFSCCDVVDTDWKIEIVPLRISAPANALATSANWL